MKSQLKLRRVQHAEDLVRQIIINLLKVCDLKLHEALTLTALWANSADDKLMINIKLFL